MITIINKLDRAEVQVNDTCYRVQLSSDGVNAVDRCSCGTIAIHIGAMTIRIDSDDLDDLAATILSAALRNREILDELEGPRLQIVPNDPGQCVTNN